MTGSGFTYQAAGADSYGGSADAGAAVSGGQNGVGVQEGSAAEVRAAPLQGDDEGEVSSAGRNSANDLELLLGGRDGGAKGDGGEAESGDESLENHDEEASRMRSYREMVGCWTERTEVG